MPHHRHRHQRQLLHQIFPTLPHASAIGHPVEEPVQLQVRTHQPLRVGLIRLHRTQILRIHHRREVCLPPLQTAPQITTNLPGEQGGAYGYHQRG